MSNQGGLKHAATEPSHLENKRERRRGAAGRAAVLRRAPSDSDCSGETASLSADSGDRVVRPQPPPVRSGKSRSRRRGSEWEVLEGLKDGQRFDRRPEVFNGYLHKKRKWPLKGWHKRFFVVDGGILVYARSPTDVARGRLHGSVDVGLSVISAKARRRRIDIDADEFIYHLRAKTPDVFRTWLNVLKVHRLYRQHLLTFGARESIPKIHPPLEDLPPPDSTPRMSHSSQESFSSSTSEGTIPKGLDSVLSQKLSQKLTYNSSIYKKKSKNSINNWFSESFDKNKLLPLKFEPLDKLCNEKTDTAYQNHGSLCSMNCVVRRLDSIPYEDLESQSPKWSPGLTDNENHMQSKQLDSNSLKSADLQIQSSLMYKCSFNTAVNKTSKSSDRSFQSKEVMSKRKRSIFVDKSIDPTTAFFFFSRKRIQSKSLSMKESGMKRSKKCTNLVKYKNMSEEPPLPKPLSKSMLLATKFREKVSRGVGSGGYAVPKTVISYAVQVNTATEHKSLQDTMTSSEYDGITEKIMLSMFECYSNKYKTNYDTVQVKYYLDQIVRELYSLKWSQTDEHPVKILFRCLLEYWLKNTSLENFKETMTQVKSVNRQSNKHFAQYENLSSLFSNKFDKDSKVRICNVKHKTKENKKEDIFKGPSETTASYEKEKRIQELEKLLKSTVYICETARARRSKEKDIETTRKIMDNFENFTRKSDVNHFNDDDIKDNSDSSTELPRLQETINDLISSTAIPPGIAKEFFGAYLDVLLNESSKSINSYSSPSAGDSNNNNPKCDVQTETVRINVSTTISTLKENPELSNKTLEGDKEEALLENQQPVEPGQFYLKSILEKLTTIFSKVDPTKPNSWSKNVKKKVSKPDVAITEGKMKNKLGRPMHKNSGHNLITENKNDNTVVVNLSKFDLEKISLFSDPGMKGTMLITLKVKERPDAFSEFRHTTLNLNFFNRNSSPLNLEGNKNTWTSCNSTTTNNAILRSFDTCTSFKNPFLDLDFNRERIDLKPYLSSSDATSKRYCHITHGSENSLDLTFFKSNSFVKGLSDPKISFEGKHDPQCYIMSSLKKKSTSIIQSKKKVKIKTSDGISLNRSESSSRSETGRPPELLFGKATPRIIDENFIILLLENLSLLSQSTPELHKDINSLYVKLKKKQEKLVKNSSNTQGLGLLGKIYNEVDMIQVKDDSTQFDMNICPMTRIKTVESGINTGIYSNCAGPSSTPVQFIDKSLSAFVVCIKHNQCGVQTDNIGCCSEDTQIASTSKRNITDYSLIETKTCNAQTYVTSKHDDVRQETTICDSKRRKESSSRKLSLSAAIKCIVNNNDSCNNFRCVSCKDEEIKNAKKNTYQTTTKSRMHSNKVREDLVHELSPVSPLKNCMRSQSDGKTAEIVNNLSENDFKLYRLFVSSKYNPNKSNSVTDSKIIIKERSDDLKTIYRCANNRSFCSESGGPLENVSRELGQAQLSLQQLQRLLDALELQHQVHHDTDVSLEGASPSVKKDRRKFGLRKKKSNSKCASVELTLPQHIDPSSSYMALSTLTAPPSPGGGSSSMPNSAASLPIACAAARPQSLPGAESLGPMAGPASLTSLTPDQQLREDFTVLAKDLLTTLKGLMSTLVCERGRLRAAMDATDTTSPTGGAVVAALRTNLTSALQQNSELRSRLSRIHDASDLTEITAVNTEVLTRQFHQSLSYSSSCVSASEFFDAEEHDDDLKPTEILDADETGVIELDGDSTSEAGSMSSEDGSASSDNSDGAMLSAEQVALRLNQNGIEPLTSRSWTRRTCLPCPRPTPGGPSLWNLLYKNIGKDLSQISMPVTINEPLNMLQRLCEELEYSELLDAACECKSAVERMALIAAFAVSAYAASAHRAASKPFNPLLAETYECVRDDRGFRFLAEQVSHHPPISACHAESPRWCFWQEARIKTKFWGKSMEFQPTGRVHVRLFSTGDHYSWNKVTTCVHNLFGGQRWVDQYGDMHIVCHGTDISCKLNFIKASSWSSSRHEVRGAVAEGGSGTRLRLQGRWSEALYAGEPPAARCLWRPGAMPPEHEVYYGFTRFAMELNELEPGMRDVLPHTDTRLRPDQRALEEGDVEAAERYKRDLEQSQRERRRDIPDHTPRWFRKTSEGGEETWLFTGEYWKAREAGFSEHGPRIW